MINNTKTKACKPSVITADQVRELLHYDPSTGVLTWKERGDNPQWSSRRAGKRAGSVNRKQYRAIKAFGKMYQGHRLIWLIMTGDWPAQQIDHINGIRDDNRWVNLREVSNTENLKNRKLPRHNTSGAMGVYDMPSGRYRAYIGHGGKRKYLGSFDTFEEAVAARKQAEIDLDYHPNHGRVTA